MADVLWSFLGVLVTISAIILGACHLLRFEDFDSVRVNRFLQKNEANFTAFVIGHRGTTVDAPENTLTAFRVAAASGVHAVEFDVDFTKDGHAVIIHDTTVDRTTDGNGKVSEYTLAEIRKLNALAGFKNRYGFGNSSCIIAFYC